MIIPNPAFAAMLAKNILATNSRAFTSTGRNIQGLFKIFLPDFDKECRLRCGVIVLSGIWKRINQRLLLGCTEKKETIV